MGIFAAEFDLSSSPPIIIRPGYIKDAQLPQIDVL
jgi:hypothetical protein